MWIITELHTIIGLIIYYICIKDSQTNKTYAKCNLSKIIPNKDEFSHSKWFEPGGV